MAHAATQVMTQNRTQSIAITAKQFTEVETGARGGNRTLDLALTKGVLYH